MMLKDKHKSELTKKFLQSISNHLSGRKDCKGLEYVVTIGTEVNEQYVAFEPVRLVFPNRYKRCESDKVYIISHVVKEHLPELRLPSDDFNVDTSKLIRGVYIYQSSVDKKSRRWVRLNDSNI